MLPLNTRWKHYSSEKRAFENIKDSDNCCAIFISKLRVKKKSHFDYNLTGKSLLKQLRVSYRAHIFTIYSNLDFVYDSTSLKRSLWNKWKFISQDMSVFFFTSLSLRYLITISPSTEQQLTQTQSSMSHPDILLVPNVRLRSSIPVRDEAFTLDYFLS